MASPVGEREARLERPLRVGLVLLPAALALTAMVLTACGGGGPDDGAKVEASLQHYLSTLDPDLSTLDPQQSLGQTRPAVGVFPIGAGPPRVRGNSCKMIHTGKVRAQREPERFAQRGFQRGSRVGRASSGSGRPHCLWPSL
jgi:hypothetical protein